MEKCDCWRNVTYHRWVSGICMFWPYDRYECWGTKERDECSCDGDPAKCDFYPEKRKRAKESCKNDHNNLCQKEDKTTTSCVENNNKCTFDEDGMMATLPDTSYVLSKDDAERIRKVVDMLNNEFRRNDTIMNTAEMWLAAQSDGKTYKTGDMRYSHRNGFHDKKGSRWNPDAFSSIEDIMTCQWVECREMTRAEAEKKLGVEIID